jgi:hypothetical protein
VKLAFVLAAGALTLAAPAQARPPHHPAPAPAAEGAGPAYYINSSGHRVHRPERAPATPAGATARCRDGAWSFSEHHRGTCSHHGGVAAWL